VSASRTRISKSGGDDRYSWAVFLDGRRVVAGLSRDEAQWHRRRIDALLAETKLGPLGAPR
jgi:hypothetical protein